MTKGQKITIKITYDMYLFFNRYYKTLNEKRENNNLQPFKNKSEFYNYFVDIYVQKLTNAKSKKYDEFSTRITVDKLKKIKTVEGKKCKVISFTLKAETAWYIKYYMSKFNEETINKNVYLIFALHYLKNKSQR